MDPNSSNQAAAMHAGGFNFSLTPNNNGDEQQQQHQTPSPTPTVQQQTSSRRASSSSATTRGRPSGSRNRPKPPIYINQESPNALRTHLMEIPPNHDVVKALKDFVRLRNRGICILNASGSVANVRVHTPVVDGCGIVKLPGIYKLLNLSGTFLPQPSNPAMPGLTVLLSHPHGSGHVLGGSVEGELIAAGLVMVTATSFANAEFERLPLAPEDGHGNNEQVNMILPVLGEEAYNVAHLQPKSEAMEPQQQQQMAMHSKGFNPQNLIPATDFWGGQPF